MPKFNIGETVIAVHDNERLSYSSGDRFIVRIPFTPCCGGFIVEEMPNHLRPEDFELFKPREGTKAEGSAEAHAGGSVPLEKVLMAMNHLAHLPLSSREGMIPIELFVGSLGYVLDYMDVREPFNNKFNPQIN